MRKLVLAVVIFAFPHVSFARGVSADWTSLKMLQPGQKIRVIEKNHKKESGRFVSLSDEEITLREKTGNESITRTSVLEVDVSGNRLKHTLIGMGVGGGAGAAIGAGITERPGSILLDVSRAKGAAFFGMLGAMVGTVVGVVLPAHKAVYRAQ